MPPIKQRNTDKNDANAANMRALNTSPIDPKDINITGDEPVVPDINEYEEPTFLNAIKKALGTPAGAAGGLATAGGLSMEQMAGGVPAIGANLTKPFEWLGKGNNLGQTAYGVGTAADFADRIKNDVPYLASEGVSNPSKGNLVGNEAGQASTMQTATSNPMVNDFVKTLASTIGGAGQGVGTGIESAGSMANNAVQPVSQGAGLGKNVSQTASNVLGSGPDAQGISHGAVGAVHDVLQPALDNPVIGGLLGALKYGMANSEIAPDYEMFTKMAGALTGHPGASIYPSPSGEPGGGGNSYDAMILANEQKMQQLQPLATSTNPQLAAKYKPVYDALVATNKSLQEERNNFRTNQGKFGVAVLGSDAQKESADTGRTLSNLQEVKGKLFTTLNDPNITGADKIQAIKVLTEGLLPEIASAEGFKRVPQGSASALESAAPNGAMLGWLDKEGNIVPSKVKGTLRALDSISGVLNNRFQTLVTQNQASPEEAKRFYPYYEESKPDTTLPGQNKEQFEKTMGETEGPFGKGGTFETAAEEAAQQAGTAGGTQGAKQTIASIAAAAGVGIDVARKVMAALNAPTVAPGASPAPTGKSSAKPSAAQIKSAQEAIAYDKQHPGQVSAAGLAKAKKTLAAGGM